MTAPGGIGTGTGPPPGEPLADWELQLLDEERSTLAAEALAIAFEQLIRAHLGHNRQARLNAWDAAFTAWVAYRRHDTGGQP